MKIKCYEITPHPDRHFDSLVLIAGKTWGPVSDVIEDVLDSAFLRQDEPDGEDWSRIKVEIKCVLYSEDDLAGMGFTREQVNASDHRSFGEADGCQEEAE